jgi:hypothetical protein
MSLSAGQKKVLHTVLVGFMTGGLTYISALAAGGKLPGIRAILVGVAVAGISRVAGLLLAKIETQPPGPTT